MALACSGTNKVMKCPAPTAWPASHRRLDPSPDSRAGRGPIHWSHGHLRRIRTVGLCRVGHCGVIRSDGRPWVGGLPRSSHVGFGEVTANAAEALLAAFAATLIARKFLAPNFALIAAAILPLVPGLSLFTGLLQAVESGTEPGDLAASGVTLLQALGVAVGIAGGATLGTVLRSSRQGATPAHSESTQTAAPVDRRGVQAKQAIEPMTWVPSERQWLTLASEALTRPSGPSAVRTAQKLPPAERVHAVTSRAPPCSGQQPGTTARPP